MGHFMNRNTLPSLKEIPVKGEIRLMEKKDVPRMFQLYYQCFEKCNIKCKFSHESMLELMLPNKDTGIYTWVFEVEFEGKKYVTDFVSVQLKIQQCAKPDY